MSELHTHYEVKNGKLVPKKENQPTAKKENQDKPASSAPSNSSGYGDEKK